jgi:hypothetical protein
MADLSSARRDGDAIIALEHQVVHDVGAAIRHTVTGLLKAIIDAWHALIGPASAVPVTRAEHAALVHIQHQVVTGLANVSTTAAVTQLRRDVERAATLGAHLGANQAGIAPVPVTVPRDVIEAIGKLDEVISARLEVGQKLATTAGTLPKLTHAIAAANSAAHHAERVGTFSVMRAANMAVHAQARAAGQRVLWVAERNACLYCLAQSGQLADENGEFDARRAFGETKQLPVWPSPPLEAPPRHPNCRCHLVVYLGHEGPGLSLPEALRREAQRSVVIGLALPSEPVSQRTRAARRLVDAGTGAPKTVLARTRKQLLSGVFTTRSR